MKKMYIIITALMLTTLLPLVSKAQLYFHNNTNEPVYVAIGIYYNGSDSKYWGTNGWFKVEPGDKTEVNSGIGSNDNIYYYAYSSISKKKYEGENKMLVHPTDKFFIKNADKDYNTKEHPEYVWEKFRHIDMKEKFLQLSYTIELSY